MQTNDREIIIVYIDISDDVICKDPVVISFEHDVTAFTFCSVDQHLYIALWNIDLIEIIAINSN